MGDIIPFQPYARWSAEQIHQRLEINVARMRQEELQCEALLAELALRDEIEYSPWPDGDGAA